MSGKEGKITISFVIIKMTNICKKVSKITPKKQDSI
jgi:hypothetical protein